MTSAVGDESKKVEGKGPRPRPEGLWRRTWRFYRRSRVGLVGLVLVFLLIIIGVLAPVLANDKPILCKYEGEIYAPALVELVWNIPFSRHIVRQSYPFDQATFQFKTSVREQKDKWDWIILPLVPYGPLETSSEILDSGGSRHWLGTDASGRDLMARMIYGARVSMLVGFVSVGISTIIGLFMGSLAGFFGGWIDTVISRIIEIVMCFPVFFLILSIIAWTGPSIWNVMIAIGVTRWTSSARYVRGEFMRIREMEYCLAADALGASDARIIFRHLLPNSLAPVFVTVTFGIAAAILVEAGLSFLGFGVTPPEPSWGNILHGGWKAIQTTSHMIFPPVVAIFIGVLSYNLVGDTLRDAIDPRVSKV